MSERARTRDLLLDYNPIIIPPRPHSAGLGIIYPWENISLSIFSQQLFKIAKNSGFNGSQKDFEEKFGLFFQNKTIIFSNLIDFPKEGEFNKLYFALDEKILYYWENEYIPINAMLIEDTIIEGGEA